MSVVLYSFIRVALGASSLNSVHTYIAVTRDSNGRERERGRSGLDNSSNRPDDPSCTSCPGIGRDAIFRPVSEWTAVLTFLTHSTHSTLNSLPPHTSPPSTLLKAYQVSHPHAARNSTSPRRPTIICSIHYLTHPHVPRPRSSSAKSTLPFRHRAG